LHTARVRRDGALWQVDVGERRIVLGAQLDGESLHVERDGRREQHRFMRTRDGHAERVWLHGPLGTHAYARVDRTAHALAGTAAGAAAGNALRAPMP
ncbi:hypothetical protein, partial [Escherichia coli]|uniref:hypothetical protein n=1 Tax=Escherichia coli TaxID=562 RepID=UPI001CC08E27